MISKPWPVSSLGQLKVFSRYGPRFSSDAYSDDGVAVLRTSDISEGGKVDWARAPLLPLALEELEKYRVLRGDVLVTRTGSLGTVAVFDDDLDAVPGAYLIQYRLKRPGTGSWWVYYFLRSPTGQRALVGGGAGVGRPNLNAPTIDAITIPVPEEDEQRSVIAEIERQSTRIDAGMEGLERAQANLSRYRASVLKAACEGRLVPTEAELARRESREYEPASVLLQRILKERRRIWEESELAKLKAKGRTPKDDRWKAKYPERAPIAARDAGEVPEGWVIVRLADIAEVRLGRQRSPDRATGPNMCPYLRAANVTWLGIDTTDVKEMDFTPAEREVYRLRHGDILMSEASGSASEVGKPAMWQGEIDECCFQNTLLRVRAPATLRAFIFWQLMADARLGRFEDHAPGVGIHHLGAERLSTWLIRLPPLAEQPRIVAEIQRRLSVAAALQEAATRGLQKASSLRQSLLAAAFEGRLVPPDSATNHASSQTMARPPSRTDGIGRSSSEAVADA